MFASLVLCLLRSAGLKAPAVSEPFIPTATRSSEEAGRPAAGVMLIPDGAPWGRKINSLLRTTVRKCSFRNSSLTLIILTHPSREQG